MKSVAGITFHASHNYGSVLQAYALQTAVQALGAKYEILNFRTARQIDLYTVFTKRKGLKYLLKNASHAVYYPDLHRKWERFEAFIHNRLALSAKTFSSLEELEAAKLSYDCYIAGSDQIWNPVPADFDWAYYLPFVREGRRIAYAPSFGQLASVGEGETTDRIRRALLQFDALSAREIAAKEKIYTLIGREAALVLDPTLLLPEEKWNAVCAPGRVQDEDYIFLYTLFADPGIIRMAKTLSKKLGLPIVTSNFSNQYDVFTPFKKRFDAGPEEFLNLIQNAKMVLTSSFHGTVFSILYHRPFLSIRGLSDARISSLLEICGLSDRVGTEQSVNQMDDRIFSCDFSAARRALETSRAESLAYLKSALQLEG